MTAPAQEQEPEPYIIVSSDQSWLTVRRWARDQIVKHRAALEQDLSTVDTANHRGRIAELRSLLALADTSRHDNVPEIDSYELAPMPGG